MDEIGRILDRAAASRTGHVVIPPPNTIIDVFERRTKIRTVASSVLLVAMVVAFVLALAGVGLASETVHPSERLAAATATSR